MSTEGMNAEFNQEQTDRFLEEIFQLRRELNDAVASAAAVGRILKDATKMIPSEIIEDMKGHATNLEDYDDEVRDQVADVKRLEMRYAALKSELAVAKDAVLHLVMRGVSPQLIFDFEDSDDENGGWQNWPVSELMFPAKIEDPLLEAGIRTIGALTSRIRVPRWYDDIPGLGPKAAITVADAYAEFWARHPEFCK